jgi:enoyl-CoA hydratase
MSEYEYLEIERKGKVVTCRMSNPPTHTLVAAEMAELTHFVDSLLEDEQARVVVFTGGGEGVFIAHYEVGELADTAEAQSAPAADPGKAPAADPGKAPAADPGKAPAAYPGQELHGFHRLLLRMQAAPFVTVAAINGNAAGGGLEFALGCDFRLAMDGDFRLGLPETSVGIIPGAGGTQRFVRLLGTARALDLILHARVMAPAEALDVGIVHRVFPAYSFESEVRAFALDLAQRAPIALAAAKRAIYAGSEVNLEAGLAVEQRQFDRCMASEDAATAMRSFVNGESWTWQGR